MSQSKIKFLITELVESLHLNESTEENVDIVSQNLIINNAEFKRIPKPKFKELVKATLTDVVKGRVVHDSGLLMERKSSNLATPTPKKDANDANGTISSSSSSGVSKTPSTGVKRKRSALTQKLHSPEMTQSNDATTSRPSVRLSDLAGLDSTIQTVKELVFYPVQLPVLYKQLGIQPPSGLLLHGPSGCGKTTLAMAIAGELDLPFFKVSGPELIGGTSGESETRIRELFDNAIRQAPSIIFIDAIDVIASKREGSQRGMDRRVVAQLFDCIDDLRNLGKISSEVCSSTRASSGNINNEEECGDSLVADCGKAPSATHDPIGIGSSSKHVIFIAATDKPDSVDPGVRGRFSKELALPVPDSKARTLILKLATKQMKLDKDVDFEGLGKATPGFVGADLHALCSEAGVLAVKRIVSLFPVDRYGVPAALEQIDASIQQQSHLTTKSNTFPIDHSEAGSEMDVDVTSAKEEGSSSRSIDQCGEVANGGQLFNVTMADFLQAAKNIQPSAKREGFAVVPDVTWSDVGALSSVREELLHNVIEPISHPERFIQLGLEVPAGVLFFGPPGCGKTLLAKALSNQSGANFISVKGPELLNMYVGESESRVRQVFTRARASAPCVIFFDELDALCPRRGMGADGGSGVSERVVNQLLTELDGLESRKDVYVIAATNRLELIDDAMLRPGRLGKLLYVPLPSASDRGSILQAVSRKLSVSPEVDFNMIGADTRADGFSGADLAALVREAGMGVMQDWRNNKFGEGLESVDAANGAVSTTSFSISSKHFDLAFGKVRASVNVEDRLRYDRVHTLISVDGLGAIEALRKAREEFD
mmetsp:Transcript_7423/g.12481  ORF Transcript_7423/g.12481 Transcript_7423/m.12481 type:complete len:825 (-) Transcript_7423:114-2588(-)